MQSPSLFRGKNLLDETGVIGFAKPLESNDKISKGARKEEKKLGELSFEQYTSLPLIKDHPYLFIGELYLDESLIK